MVFKNLIIELKWSFRRKIKLFLTIIFLYLFSYLISPLAAPGFYFLEEFRGILNFALNQILPFIIFLWAYDLFILENTISEVIKVTLRKKIHLYFIRLISHYTYINGIIIILFLISVFEILIFEPQNLNIIFLLNVFIGFLIPAFAFGIIVGIYHYLFQNLVTSFIISILTWFMFWKVLFFIPLFIFSLTSLRFLGKYLKSFKILNPQFGFFFLVVILEIVGIMFLFNDKSEYIIFHEMGISFLFSFIPLFLFYDFEGSFEIYCAISGSLLNHFISFLKKFSFLIFTFFLLMWTLFSLKNLDNSFKYSVFFVFISNLSFWSGFVFLLKAFEISNLSIVGLLFLHYISFLIPPVQMAVYIYNWMNFINPFNYIFHKNIIIIDKFKILLFGLSLFIFSYLIFLKKNYFINYIMKDEKILQRRRSCG